MGGTAPGWEYSMVVLYAAADACCDFELEGSGTSSGLWHDMVSNATLRLWGRK